jgi:hypothetical protein
VYGSYDFPVKIELNEILISVEKENGNLIYRRKFGDDEVEKILLAEDAKLIVNPVEPVNKPVEVTSFLQIEFSRSVVVEPKSTRHIYLKFPVEIGVIVSSPADIEVLDIFAPVKPKYTLYGDPRNGIICKYWKSNIFSSIPGIDPLKEGVMELTIKNKVNEWVTITRAVFNGVEMKIYYSEDFVSMKALMDVSSKTVAETDFIDAPLKAGMKKSIEIYTARKIPIVGKKLEMEWGL